MTNVKIKLNNNFTGLSFMNEVVKSNILETQKENQEQNNKIGIRNYELNKKLLDNSINEKSMNTIDHYNCIQQTRKWIIYQNLLEAIL